ncbi:MAG: peptidoglycan DD-metalloendopeptidase family protein [Actinobacteria bacterium]|nr:peptidoglycan DD-metalloendopeptidase family protein [Actinomycetota bacterium]
MKIISKEITISESWHEKNKKHKKVRFSIISLFIILFFSLAQFVYPSSLIYSDTAPSQDQLEQIKKEKEENRIKIEEAQKEQEAYANQVNEVEKKLLSALTDLKELNDSLAEAKSESDKTTLLFVSNESELLQLEQELQAKTDILNNRIAEIYKKDNRNILNILLKTSDFIEFFSRLKLLSLLVKKDSEIIEEIKEKKSELLTINKNIIDLREKQKTEKQKIEKLLNMSEQKNKEIEVIYDQKVDLFSQAKANKDALIAMENQLISKETEITNILHNYNYGTAPTGRLLWPTNGRISSKFGSRTSKTTGRTRVHNGIDIYAPLGTPVIAADSGQILKAEYDGGYGYSILVYHGGGVATLYAHLSGFNVSVGQYVQRGQIIGYVGNTGYTTGYHLHFEVRINGNPQNPVNYL